MKRTLTTVLTIAVLLASPAAFAWGEKGHRLTALVAMELLTDDARAKLKTLMGSDDLATFSLYMDQNKPRLANEYKGSREWHYDDKPVCEANADDEEFCRDGNCASVQIAKYYKILADDHSTKAEKQFAVYVLVHVVGDIHQPLHASDNGDRGGNDIRVKLPGLRGKGKNLHSVWDTDFVRAAISEPNERRAAQGLVRQLCGRDVASPGAEKASIDSCPTFGEWAKKRERAWIAESHAIAKDMTYGTLPGFSCGADIQDKPVELTTEYVKAATDRIPEQISKAGVRIARVLNRALTD